MTHRQLRAGAIGATLGLFLLAGCASRPVAHTPQQAMVEARAAFLATTGLFTVYAAQPWCGPPPAPKPPLCADREVVREGARQARTVNTALDAADAVIAASGTPDMRAITDALAAFSALATAARGQ